MAIIMVSYDLNKSGKDYEGLIADIKSYPGWCHVLKSTWLVSTDKSPTDVYNKLQKHLDSDDRILINYLKEPNQGWLAKDSWTWINKHI